MEIFVYLLIKELAPNILPRNSAAASDEYNPAPGAHAENTPAMPIHK